MNLDLLCRCRVWSVFGPPAASPPRWALVYRGCPAGTHQCATESRMTLWQSANPVRAVGVCAPVASSSPSNVFFELFHCEGVSHREAVSLQTTLYSLRSLGCGITSIFCASQLSSCVNRGLDVLPNSLINCFTSLPRMQKVLPSSDQVLHLERCTKQSVIFNSSASVLPWFLCCRAVSASTFTPLICAILNFSVCSAS